MQHLAKALLKPGVKLDFGPDTPLFYADADQLGRLIRKLNGEVTRGVFEDGAFKMTDDHQDDQNP